MERSGYSTGAPKMRTAFPYAKFVHLFRDGPDCALSMSRRPGYRTTTLLREIRERAGAESFRALTEEHAEPTSVRRHRRTDVSPMSGTRARVRH